MAAYGARLTSGLNATVAQVLYYDGQFDDARYNVALATTAAAAGAVVLNYAEADGLIKVRIIFSVVMPSSRRRLSAVLCRAYTIL
jgi:glycerol-3-phosphate dehydrogenase